MDRPARAHYDSWIVTNGDPKPATMLPAPRRAVITTHTYGGHKITVQLYVVARSRGFVCVEQDISGRAPWYAWIPDRQAMPV
ncbi:hypothetical protein [Cellulomonas carbonis]|uniref:hypothetical protein n=1 Tax=Cellulomonas carbonis TaxID=1386092 RepID=UPI0016652165|nr:hypothetical protein [Cellulomonas carbonis]